MKYLLFFVIHLAYFNSFAFDHAHKEWEKTLKAYQSEKGLIKYALLKSDLNKFKSHQFLNYVESLQKIKPDEYSRWSPNEQKSFLINAYNALTVQLIINHYPIKSIKKIGGLFGNPWKLKFFKLLDGKIESLDPIEHEWLRPQFKDYRIHAAVNCASISCPPLRHEAFVPSKLDQQLNDQISLWIKDKSRNDISAGDVFYVSKIFDWYKKDFEDWGGGVLTVLKKFGSVEASSDVKIKYLDYNWDLNESR